MAQLIPFYASSWRFTYRPLKLIWRTYSSSFTCNLLGLSYLFIWFAALINTISAVNLPALFFVILTETCLHSGKVWPKKSTLRQCIKSVHSDQLHIPSSRLLTQETHWTNKSWMSGKYPVVISLYKNHSYNKLQACDAALLTQMQWLPEQLIIGNNDKNNWIYEQMYEVIQGSVTMLLSWHWTLLWGMNLYQTNSFRRGIFQFKLIRNQRIWITKMWKMVWTAGRKAKYKKAE